MLQKLQHLLAQEAVSELDAAAYSDCIVHPIRKPTMQGPFDSDTLARLHERAHAWAPRLREEAIDDFWRGADEVLRRGIGSSQRAALRLLQRLRRHESKQGACAAANDSLIAPT